MNQANNDPAVFSKVKVHRGWYFVEYATPVVDAPFATVSLTVLEDRDAGAVAAAMEAELDAWLERYTVPIMVSAFNDVGDSFRVAPARPCDHLIGWLASDSKAPVRHWRIVPSAEFPSLALTPLQLRSLYHDIPFRTAADLKTSVKAHKRMARTGTTLVFVVFVVAPVTWLLIEFNAPGWLSWGLLLYGLAELYVRALKLLGDWPQTEADAKKASEESAMRHHHYHCQRNPEGFRRLVAENFDREAKARTHEEAERIKGGSAENTG